jgi:hypothetical protein
MTIAQDLIGRHAVVTGGARGLGPIRGKLHKRWAENYNAANEFN